MNNINENLSILVSAIIALSAVISPVLTSIINNLHQRTMKKLEHKEKYYDETISYQRKIFEDYLSAIGKCVSSNFGNAETQTAYNTTYLRASLYATKELQQLMKITDNAIRCEKTKETLVSLNELIPKISEYLQLLQR